MFNQPSDLESEQEIQMMRKTSAGMNDRTKKILKDEEENYRRATEKTYLTSQQLYQQQQQPRKMTKAHERMVAREAVKQKEKELARQINE